MLSGPPGTSRAPLKVVSNNERSSLIEFIKRCLLLQAKFQFQSDEIQWWARCDQSVEHKICALIGHFPRKENRIIWPGLIRAMVRTSNNLVHIRIFDENAVQSKLEPSWWHSVAQSSHPRCTLFPVKDANMLMSTTSKDDYWPNLLRQLKTIEL